MFLNMKEKMDSLSFEEELSFRGEEEEVIEYQERTTDSSFKRKRNNNDDFQEEDDDVRNYGGIEAKRVCQEDKSKFAGEFVQAARTGNFEVMKKLVEQGVDVNERVCGCTALMYASFYGREEMVDYLIKLGAKIDESNLSGQTALIWAVERQHYSTVQALLKAHANVNVVDKKGLNALHKAVRSGNEKMVRLLVEEGQANVNFEASKEFDCCSVLQDAAFYGQNDIVQFLLEHDASVEQKNSQGRTALHRGVYKNHAQIVQLLLDCGADVNAQENTLRTPLHWAAFFGHLESFKILLDNGADVTLKDKVGLTAEDIAVNREQNRILDYLSEWQQQQQNFMV